MPDTPESLRLLEAMLFATQNPLTVAQMEERLPEGTDVHGLLRDIKNHYEDRGINLVQIGNEWAFRTANDLGDALVLERTEERTLSRAAMETLSIIAYHQPVTRAEIENIRGVATSKGTLDILIEIGWVKPGRRRQVPGRPLTWVVTNAFLDHFGLEAMTDLPGLDELKSAGLLDRRPAIETIPGTPDMFEDEELEAQEEASEDVLHGDPKQEVSA